MYMYITLVMPGIPEQVQKLNFIGYLKSKYRCTIFPLLTILWQLLTEQGPVNQSIVGLNSLFMTSFFSNTSNFLLQKK